MASVSGAYSDTIEITTPNAVSKGNVCIVGNVVGLAAESAPANGNVVLITNGSVRLPKRQNGTAITLGQKVYARHNDDKINQASANGYTTYLGDALNASAGGSGDEVLVWLGRIGA